MRTTLITLTTVASARTAADEGMGTVEAQAETLRGELVALEESHAVALSASRASLDEAQAALEVERGRTTEVQTAFEAEQFRVAEAQAALLAPLASCCNSLGSVGGAFGSGLLAASASVPVRVSLNGQQFAPSLESDAPRLTYASPLGLTTDPDPHPECLCLGH